MLPFNIQCKKCGEYMYRGKKFNSKKEDVHGEDYLGIKKFRFYMKCCVCSSVFSIKTDPERGDYETELGCTRLFEVWNQQKKEAALDAEARAAEELGDSMKALENRTIQQKQEMDVLDALDLMQAQNDRNSGIDTTAILDSRKEESEKAKQKMLALTEADEAEAKSAFSEKLQRLPSPESSKEKKMKMTGLWLKKPDATATTATAAPAVAPAGPIFVAKLKKKAKKKKKKKKKRKREKDGADEATEVDIKKVKA